LEEVVPQRVAPAVFGTLQRREFPGSKLSGFTLAVFKICRAPHVFLYRFAHFLVVIIRVATLPINLTKNPPNLLPVFYFPQSKIKNRRSKNCSAGNPPPLINPGLMSTRMDAILK
jgi:hypothetical protein